ncbi:MAG: 4-alpha-glucanotransferase [Syntrophales bacterium]|nr:4-alpha-glucanotransferase [Syntrophales bacterium]
MKIIFSLPFQTTYSQNVLIVGSTPELGQWEADRGLRMRYHAGGVWQADIKFSEEEREPFAYRYAIEDRNAGIIRFEGGGNRRFAPRDYRGSATVEQRDFWHPPVDPEAIFATAPFRRVIFRRPQIDQIGVFPDREATGISVRLYVPAPRVAPGQSVYCAGNIPALGLWNPEKALPLHDSGYPDWHVDFHVRRVEIPFQYKYFITDSEKKTIFWESGDNRRLSDHNSFIDEENRMIVVSDYAFKSSTAHWKGAGLAIPVFSLRTAKGLGVGEFPDLKLLADWAKQMGLQMIQLLPVNDTSVCMNWSDAYPYSTLSVFALHPLYLNLQAIEGLSASLIREIDAAAEQLNRKSVVDYEAVMSAKMGFLKRIFARQARSFLASVAFQAFLMEHTDWLKPYAAFCHLRDLHGTSDYRNWGKFSRMTPAAIDQLTDPGAPHARKLAFYYFLQYHLHHQLLAASQYARDCGVVLKGDIPIGVDKMSVETWLHPEWFRMDKSAGAPPDDFAIEGQNWGFPTYDWEAMAADGYTWWKRRLLHLSRYFVAIRLDHVIGFFRIWEIPGDAVTALRGRFNPAIPLSRNELEDAGIKNVDVLCEVPITVDFLENVFGARTEEVIREYLEPSTTGRYRLRPEFDAQNKVAARFSSHMHDTEDRMDEHHALLRGLFRLHDDVILIPDKPGDRDYFHPRIALDLTWAFQTLDGQTQAVLRRFYEDYYFERQEYFWARDAGEKLSALKSATDMLICGEDLGMVPRCVAGVMENLGLLGLCIQRMPADPRIVLAVPDSYPYLSVASPSSHDMPTIRGWWEEADRAVVQICYSEILGHSGVAPKACEPWICREMVVLHLNSSSMWAVFPVQDILGMSADLRRPDPREERINEPADANHRWNFRLHLTLETLLQQQSFNAEVREMVSVSSRFSRASFKRCVSRKTTGPTRRRKTPCVKLRLSAPSDLPVVRRKSSKQ